jgi:mono/diheme cytochrome c family protein
MTKHGFSTRSISLSLLLLPVLASAAFALAAKGTAQPDRGAIGAGRGTYRTYCATCHGEGGLGDGPLAQHLKVRPTDLTRIAQKNGGEFPFEKVGRSMDGRAEVAGHGSADMPIWGDAFGKTLGNASESEVKTRIEQVTHYLWSIQVLKP